MEHYYTQRGLSLDLLKGEVEGTVRVASIYSVGLSELARLEKLKASLKPNGALWIIRPKGRPEISERATMAAGKAAGLVDVKVVRFTETHTAEKFVIPVRSRP